MLNYYEADGTLIETNYIEPDAYFQKQPGLGKSVAQKRRILSAPDATVPAWTLEACGLQVLLMGTTRRATCRTIEAKLALLLAHT